MIEISHLELLTMIRLPLAAFFGGMIGLEREAHGRPAGLRTHLLVSMGSCLVMLLSIYGFGPGWTRDPARLAAQVISGIGFLGAGTIMREGLSVKGLTTAASLWVVAGIGLAIGAGFYFGGIVTALFAVLALFFLERAEKRFISPRATMVELFFTTRTGKLDQVRLLVNQHGFSIRHLDFSQEETSGESTLVLQVEGRTAKSSQMEILLSELGKLPDLKRMTWS